MSKINRIFLFIGLVIIILFSQIEVLFGITAAQLKQQELLFIVTDFFIWLLIMWLLIKVAKRPFFDEQKSQVIFFSRINWQKIGITLGTLAAALLLNYVDEHYISAALPENQQIINYYSSQAPLLVSIGNYLFAPTMEELLFRGIFFRMFFPKNNAVNTVLRIVVSGLAFGFAHELTIGVDWLVYCLMGWLLGITYHFTKELAYPMGLHLLVNLM